MGLILMICVMFIVMFTARPLSVWVLVNLLKTHNIANPSTRKLVESVVTGGVWVSLFAIGFGLIGMPYGLTNFLVVWAVLSVIEYILPARR